MMSRLESLQARLSTTVQRLGAQLPDDPANPFHALRQYMLEIGLGSRLISHGHFPSYTDPKAPSNATSTSTVDNSFFFEMRRKIRASGTSPVVDAVVLVGRVIFHDSQDSTRFYVQLVPNHKHDGVLCLNDAYRALEALVEGWKARDERGYLSVYEREYTDYQQFQVFLKRLVDAMTPLQVTGGAD